MKYRAEIDGLRALAVVPVILFHAGLEQFSGGFVGVDVFFVISGYLITTILIDDIQKRRFSITNFYERRARRILPALYMVLLFSTMYALYTSPFYARDIFQSIFATTIFSQNFLLLVESKDYFELGADEKLLFHTWSLGIEEQFYLVFPILLVAATRTRLRGLFIILSLLAFLSFTLSELGWRTNPTANFYLLPTRSWELLAGSISAITIYKTGVLRNEALSFLGLFLIVISILFYDETIPFPSVYALVPVIGTVLLVIFGEKTTLVARVLSLKPLVGIGLVSYSAYLWHQPLIVVLDREAIFFGEVSTQTMSVVTILIATLLAASISYFLIERPVRYKTQTTTFLYGILTLSAIFLVTSFIGHKTVGYQNARLSMSAKNPSLYIDSFREQERLKLFNDFPAGVDSGMLVIGDSMAGDFAKALAMKGIRIESVGLDGACFGELVTVGTACGYGLNELLRIASRKELVFIASDFVEEGSIEFALVLRERLSKSAITLLVNGFRITHASDQSYRYAVNPSLYTRSAVYNTLRPEVHLVNEHLNQAGGEVFLDKYGMFCDDTKGECMLYDNNENPLLHDELHLTLEGLSVFGDGIVGFLCMADKKYCATIEH